MAEMSLGFFSYGIAFIGFGFFALMLLVNWRRSLPGTLLTLAIVTSTIWAGLAAAVAVEPRMVERWGYQAFEILRYVAWYLFLLQLYRASLASDSDQHRYMRRISILCIAFACLLILFEYQSGFFSPLFAPADQVTLIIVGHLLLSIIGLSFVEQLFRSTAVQYRWATKYLFIAIGLIFVFDFYLYADALLFRVIDRGLWEVRGFVNVIAVPLLIIAATRNKDWSLNIFISRQVVFNTTALLGGGLYLLVMAGAGYYVNEFGGSWGRAAQIIFLSLAIVLLLMVMFSASLRAHLTVFLGKHFYSNKYDYRVEWLRLTKTLSASGGDKGGLDTAIRVLADIVEARAGALWLRTTSGDFENAAAWKTIWITDRESDDSSLIRFLEKKSYVINLFDLDAGVGEYEGLEAPGWLTRIDHAWLLVPLVGTDRLIGFVVLAKPLIVRAINWEDRDLLKTAAHQVSAYVEAIKASEALAKSKQFEVFNRLSAYMVHDLKNVAAELELITKNADRHVGNPEFLRDAFETVANASSGIQRLLAQLRNKQVSAEDKVIIQLAELLEKVILLKATSLPRPLLELGCDRCQVAAESERLSSVLAHLIDNAQHATSPDGYVKVRLLCRQRKCVMEVEDNGQGMDTEFVRHRLFKPFDTTKGNAGMGIGMYETRQFVEENGGEIQVVSEPGNGTLVRLTFPAVSVEQQTKELI